MSLNCLISIVVPVYNSEKYLTQCINSVLNQSFSDFELLLVNDGSTDQSGELCDNYAQKDERIKVYHKENGGVSSSRNLGLKNAKGDFIWFIDPDDLISENSLAVLNSKLNQNINIEVINFGFLHFTSDINKPEYIQNKEEIVQPISIEDFRKKILQIIEL